MTILRGTKGECIRQMMALEAVHGRIFWVISMDDAAGTYELQVSEAEASKFKSCVTTVN
jgi:hypothetical protein